MFTRRLTKNQSKFDFDSKTIQGMIVALEQKDEESIQGGTLIVLLDSMGGSTILRSPYEGCDPGTCCEPLK